MVCDGYARIGDGFSRCFSFGVVCLKCETGVENHILALCIIEKDKEKLNVKPK